MTTPPRSACPIAASLDLFGDRWTLVILRDMLLGGRERFAELAAEEGIATNVLSERLDRLEREGLLVRRSDPVDRRRRVYLPTPSAVALIPVLVEIAVWGVAHTAASGAAEIALAAAKDRDGLIARLSQRALAKAASE